MLVVFAYGNDGGEMTANELATAPWVLGVAAGTKSGAVAEFSSGGIEADVFGPSLENDRYVVGESRRPLQMGLYHPAVVATGEHVVSTRATGAPIPLLFAGEDAARPPGEVARYTSASGTSMAAPVAAGVAALVLEANLSLGPEAVKRVLQVTARSVPGAPFYRQGYGYLDAAAAVELARSLGMLEPGTAALQLENQQAGRDTAVLAALAHPTQAWSWLFNGPDGSSGLTHTVQVPAGTSRLKVLSLFVSLIPVGVQAPLRIFDADGREVAATGDIVAGGEMFTLDLDLRPPDRPARIIAQADEPIDAAPLSIHPVMVPFRIATGYTLAAGHRLALQLDVTPVGSVGDTLLYDSDDYPSALTLSTGTLPAGCPTAAAVGLTPPLTDRVPGAPPSRDSDRTSGATAQVPGSKPSDGPPTAPAGSGVPVDQNCSCLPFDPLAGTVKPHGWRTGLGG